MTTQEVALNFQEIWKLFAETKQQIKHLKQLDKFEAFFPEYRDRKVLGAVAGIAIDEGADRYAYKKGLFVIGQRGETVCILNDEKFRPTAW